MINPLIEVVNGSYEFSGAIVVDRSRNVPRAEWISGHRDDVLQSERLRSKQQGFQRQAVHIPRGQGENRGNVAPVA